MRARERAVRGVDSRAAFLAARIFADVTQLAQLDDSRLIRAHHAKRAWVGPERIGRDVGITPVILRATGRAPVPKAVELLGIDRVDDKPVLKQGVDERPVRRFQADGDLRGGDPRACTHPVDGRVDLARLMRHRSLFAHAAARIDEAEAMLLTTPINAEIPGIISHQPLLSPGHAVSVIALVPALEARLPTGCFSRSTSPRRSLRLALSALERDGTLDKVAELAEGYKERVRQVFATEEPRRTVSRTPEKLLAGRAIRRAEERISLPPALRAA